MSGFTIITFTNAALSLQIPSFRNRQSKLSSLTSFIPIPKYFESEWSYARFRIPTQSAHISLTQQAAARDADDLVEVVARRVDEMREPLHELVVLVPADVQVRHA